MFFWYAGVSFVAVLLVFNSPGLDYRLVMAGSVLPAVELVYGGPWLMHTLLCPVVAMAAVMGATRHRRLRRRRWLGVPIGLFMYLVLEGAWRRTELFWWPGFGSGLGDAATPAYKPTGVIIAFEAIGLVALGWVAVRFRLHEPARLERFVREGTLGRDLMEGPEPTC